MHAILDETKQKMEAAMEQLHKELASVRTGRANPALFEQVAVEVYGSTMRIKDLAQISTPEPRAIVITPFDPQTASAIEKGIEKANLNLRASVDGALVRIQVPPMDGTTREAMCKLAKKLTEESKVRIRQIRKDANTRIKNEKADKTLAEDQSHRLEKQVQELTDSYCASCDAAGSAKEAEVQEI